MSAVPMPGVETGCACAVKRDAIVVERRSGKTYEQRPVLSVHRAICGEAGLPTNRTFICFPHGSVMDVGSVSAHVRPIAGHATLYVTRIYNKATTDKARAIAAARRVLVIIGRAFDRRCIGPRRTDLNPP